jgi:hypothetical protein
MCCSEAKGGIRSGISLPKIGLASLAKDVRDVSDK